MVFISLIFSIALMVIASSRYSIHPFISLLFIAILFGFSSGLDGIAIVNSMNQGFGKTMGNIGLLILFGSLIGTFLEKTGAILKLSESIINRIGKKHIKLAIALIGWVVSIPVFADSGFILLNDLNRNLSFKAGLKLSKSVIILSMGLMASHVMVPPTPGPVAAASLLNADLGLVIIVGVIVSLIALFITVLVIQRFLPEFSKEEELKVKVENTYPKSAFSAAVPIVLPLILITLNSFNEYFHFFKNSSILPFIGSPVIALIIGFISALFLPSKLEKNMVSASGWIGESLKDVANILFITGAGGAFGSILQEAGIGDAIKESFPIYSVGLFLPFLLSAAIKSAQGSSTVAILTTASIIAPMLPSIGYDTELGKVLMVLVIGAGSTVFSHVNDSYFWVVTQLNKFSIVEGYKTQSLASGILGVSAFIVLFILSFFLK